MASGEDNIEIQNGYFKDKTVTKLSNQKKRCNYFQKMSQMHITCYFKKHKISYNWYLSRLGRNYPYMLLDFRTYLVYIDKIVFFKNSPFTFILLESDFEVELLNA